MRILVCIDKTEQSERIAPAVRRLTQEQDEVLFLRVVDPGLIRAGAVQGRHDPGRGLGDGASPSIAAPAADPTGRPVPGAAGRIETVDEGARRFAITEDRVEAQLREQERRELFAIAHAHGFRAIEPLVVFAEDAASTILEQARERHVDVIAMTTHARGAVAEALKGSTAKTVIQDGGYPVLVVHPSD
jgi:nucleotide-binding universal stress UspA family protein